MQAIVKLERSEPTTDKPGKAKNFRYAIHQGKHGMLNRALQLNFPCSIFPCCRCRRLDSLCIVSSMDLCLPLSTYKQATLKAVISFSGLAFSISLSF